MTDDFRDRLESERRKYRMTEDSFGALERRRDRKRRNRRVGSGLVALVIAAAGGVGAFAAFRGSGSVNVGQSPTPTSVSPTVSPTRPQAVMPVSSALQFVDAAHGWMVGSNGEILATTDGGRSWVVQHQDPAATGVDFIDVLDGWALTDAGVIRTGDGGGTWGKVSDQSLRSVQFVTTDLGWAISSKPDQPEGVGDVLKTTDGGATWVPQAISADSVCAADGGNVVWAAGPGEGGISFLRTLDGGTTWVNTPIAVPQSEGWTATIRCAGADAWILLTDGGAAGHIAYGVFRTAGGGPEAAAVLQEAETHPFGDSVPLDQDPSPGQLVAFDGANAYVVAWCPACSGDLAVVAVSRTSNGGATWDRQTIVKGDRAAEPLGMSFVDQDQGWILMRTLQDNSLFVLATADGGVTWSAP
jgi:photosystem II stability/assembly factor-like uncharacterized protein